MGLRDFGFSLWCDFIERDFLERDFKKLVEDASIHGATSNPAIFQNAITNSKAYSVQKSELKNLNPKEIYEALAIEDIKRAAKILYPLFEKGEDGFISIEVDPFLSNDIDGTLAEALRLYDLIGYENVMIKIPATDAGFPVMEELISRDINVNATLIFSPSQAKKSIESMQKGFERCYKNPKAVISVFVSRFDRKCDSTLKEHGIEGGKLGIMNAQKIYKMCNDFGNKNIRTLFASTGVKGDEYEKSYYITELLHKNSVNTAPLDTIDAFFKQDDRTIKELPESKKIDEFFEKVSTCIDMDKIYEELIKDGLSAFEKSFEEILHLLEKK